MINSYAQAFMIAARTEYVAPPRIRAAQDKPKGKRSLRLFRRATQIDPTKL